MEVLVFSTTVESTDHIRILGPSLDAVVGSGYWNFALDDRDRILRIVTDRVQPLAAIQLLRDFGFDCRELED